MSIHPVLAVLLAAVVFVSISAARQGGINVPPGGLLLTTADCPWGTTRHAAADGRHLVGAAAAGTVGGTAGTALADREARVAGPHVHVAPGHTHSLPGHMHEVPGAGSLPGVHHWVTPASAGAPNVSVSDDQTISTRTGGTGSSGAGGGAATGAGKPDPAGATFGAGRIPAPYLQVRVCRVD